MARARHSYAVRLEVEGGNKVKANLTVGAAPAVSCSMRRIDRGSDRASQVGMAVGTLSRTGHR